MWEQIKARQFNIGHLFLSLAVLAIAKTALAGPAALALALGTFLCLEMRFILGAREKPEVSENAPINMWRRLPSLDEYRSSLAPQDQHLNGLICSRCRSRSIKSRGVGGYHDTCRYFVCNHCDKHLYRT